MRKIRSTPVVGCMPHRTGAMRDVDFREHPFYELRGMREGIAEDSSALGWPLETFNHRRLGARMRMGKEQGNTFE
jgi:hypothetical protein